MRAVHAALLSLVLGCETLAAQAAAPGSSASVVRQSAFRRAVGLARLDSLCGNAVCTSDGAKRLKAFLRDPFAAAEVPTEAVIAQVLADEHAAREQSDESRVRALAGRNGALQATGILGTSTIAWAAAEFLAQRAKAELVQSAIPDLASALAQPPLDSMLMRTRTALAGADALDYRVLLPTLQAAMREDLRDLPSRITVGSVTLGVRDTARVRMVAEVALVLRRMQNGESATLVLSELAPARDSRGAPWKRLLAQAAFEARALEALRGDRAVREYAGHVLSDPGLFAAFTVMLLDEAGLAFAGEEPTAAVRRVSDVVSAFYDLLDASALAAAATSADERLGARLRLGRAVAATVRTVAAGHAPADAVAGIETAFALWSAIEQEDYPRLVADIAVLLQGALADTAPERRTTVRVLAFAAALAAARDQEAVEEALEALAEPVGAFRARRGEGHGGVSLVSYVGLAGGRERVRGGSSGGVTHAGVSVPIGFELARGVDWWSVHSIGLHLSAIDLGTLVSYRLDQESVSTPGGTDEVDEAPDVSLAHIFAPGAMLTLGITERYPLTLGVGWQRAPRLRTLEASGTHLSADRIFVMLGVDLTLLRF